MAEIQLVVQGDDLGMCRAVNEGIALAATEGVLTQTSVMAPTPWFAEGAGTARRLGLVTGLHTTLTCEWDHLRWSPLTPGPSLREPDGTFHRTLAGAGTSDPADAIAEAHAQADRAEALGLELSYVDPHMGISVVPAYEAMCRRLDTRFIYKGVEPHFLFASIIILSIAPIEDRAAWFVDQLERIGPGTHFVMTHPGVPGEELRALTAPGADNALWAEPYRAADLEALCAPEVRHAIEARDIDLFTVRDL
jgi:chitin disaccharide deacetylase